MDWFFNALNDFFQLAFKGMRAMVLASGSNAMNTFLILFTAALTIWWMIQMLKHPKEQK